MPTLIASDGYEYADFAHRVAGRPLENQRNKQIVSFRFHREPEGYIKAWYGGWDSWVATPGGTREWVAAAASATAWIIAHPQAPVYGQPRRPSGASVPNPVPAAPAAVHAAN